jgi:hypothetical protein
MPIPTIALPPLAARRPWWLIVVAHEVGHHVQSDIVEAGGDGTRLSRAVEAGALAAGASGEEAARWANWSGEMFADAFALALTGTASRWAVEELELRADAAMEQSKLANYPPPLLRWVLMDQFAQRLGLPSGAYAGFDETRATPAVRGLLDRVPTILDVLAAVSVGTSNVGTMSRATVEWQRASVRWRDELLADDEPVPLTTLEATRLCAAGGVHAWVRLVDDNNGNVPAATRDAFASRLCAVVVACRPDGERAALPEAEGSLDELVNGLVDELFVDERNGWL